MLENHMTWEEICNHIIEKSNCNDKGFKEWLLSKEHLGMMFDSMLYRLAWQIYNKIHKNDMDFFLVVCGRERMGKSTLLLNFLALIDPNICMKQICFKPIDFIVGIEEGKKGNALQLDEGNLVFFSRDSMTGDSKDMVKILALMGQKNLCVGICIPNFWTIDTYVREHRVNCIINVTGRGKYRGIIDEGILLSSKWGRDTKSFKDVRLPNGTFWDGYFNKDMPTINDISPQAYLDHKHGNFGVFLSELKQKHQEKNGEKNGTSMYVSAAEAARILGVGNDTIRRYIDDNSLPSTKLGNKWMVSRNRLEALGNPHINKETSDNIL